MRIIGGMLLVSSHSCAQSSLLVSQHSTRNLLHVARQHERMGLFVRVHVHENRVLPEHQIFFAGSAPGSSEKVSRRRLKSPNLPLRGKTSGTRDV